MLEDRIKQFLRELGIDRVDHLSRKDYFSNDDPGRQIHVLDRELVVKSYGRSQFGSFEVERFIAQVGSENNLLTPSLLGQFVADDEAYLVFEFAEGSVLNDVYQQLSLDEYCAMLGCLGKAMQACHSVPLTDMASLPRTPASSPSHVAPSEHRFRLAAGIVESAREAELMSSATEERMQEALEEVSTRMFRSEPVLCHADIHNENVMLDLAAAVDGLMLIDWETAVVQPQELDFVHPYLNILGEGFPNRRLSDKPEVAAKLTASLECGYGQSIDWRVVSCHAMLWYLETAVQCRQDGRGSACCFYASAAVGAIEFARSTQSRK